MELLLHERNIKYLAIEAYKVEMVKNSAYELRNGIHFQRTNIQTPLFGSESSKTPGAKI